MKRVRFRGSFEESHGSYDIPVLMLLVVVALFAVINTYPNPSPEPANDFNPTTHVVKDKYKSAVEKLQEIETVKEGIKICENIIREGDCLLRVAKKTNNSDVCDKIDEERKADLCYLHFVNSNDYSVCEKINSGHIKQSCFSLQKLQNLKKSEEITPQ